MFPRIWDMTLVKSTSIQNETQSLSIISYSPSFYAHINLRRKVRTEQSIIGHVEEFAKNDGTANWRSPPSAGSKSAEQSFGRSGDLCLEALY